MYYIILVYNVHVQVNADVCTHYFIILTRQSCRLNGGCIQREHIGILTTLHHKKKVVRLVNLTQPRLSKTNGIRLLLHEALW